MFDNLATSLQKTWKNIAPDGKLTADNIKEPLKDIRRCALAGICSKKAVETTKWLLGEQGTGMQWREGYAV
jgi:hypothetical protein